MYYYGYCTTIINYYYDNEKRDADTKLLELEVMAQSDLHYACISIMIKSYTENLLGFNSILCSTAWINVNILLVHGKSIVGFYS